MRAAVLVLVAACGFSPNQAVDGGPGSDGMHDAPRVDAAPIDGRPDARPDAMIDALVFTPAMCPPSYDKLVASHPGSRYRFIGTKAAFATQHADCNDDHPGWTHLVVIDDLAEATEIGTYDSQSYIYVGAVQAAGQTATNLGWHRFDGAAPTTGWSPTNSQPDDGGDHFENGEESLAVIASTGNMHDVTGQLPYTAACECDGHAIPASITAMLPN